MQHLNSSESVFTGGKPLLLNDINDKFNVTENVDGVFQLIQYTSVLLNEIGFSPFKCFQIFYFAKFSTS